jgi:hypothetical protein
MSDANTLDTKKQDYRTAIVANVTPQEAFDKICRVSEWWGLNFEGKSQKLNDIFTVRFGNGDMYKIEILEIAPNKKVVWQVVDSNQTWHPDSTEWTGTKIVWEISSQKAATQIDMTHLGLVPQFECYDMCKQGWDFLLHQSLIRLLTENKGLPR